MIRTFVSMQVLRRRLALAAGVLGCVAAVGFAIPAAAAAKVASLTSCETIAAPGMYRLDADISTGASVCFEITAGGVTLNLNGHTISGQGGFGIFPNGGANAKIVGPGTLTGWSDGIQLHGGNGSVRGVTATNNEAGIFIDSGGNSIRGNVVTGNTFVGIVADFGTTDNTIIGNFVHDNSEADLVDENLNCGSNVWRGNDFGTAVVVPAPSPCIN